MPGNCHCKCDYLDLGGGRPSAVSRLGRGDETRHLPGDPGFRACTGNVEHVALTELPGFAPGSTQPKGWRRTCLKSKNEAGHGKVDKQAGGVNQRAHHRPGYHRGIDAQPSG